MNIQGTGLLWYPNANEYQKFKQACEDGHTFAPYAVWLQRATEAINRPGPGGSKVIKVDAESEAFTRHCQVHAMRPNAAARTH